MIIINDKQIQICPVETPEEMDYLNRSFAADDFQLYINDSPSASDYLLFKHNQQNVGCFSINYTTSFGVRACNPIIYVSNRVFSVLCILKMFQYIFTKLEVDKISFVVFAHNTPCLLALKKMRIHCDGELKYYREYNDCHISCYVFSILPEEYASLRERVNNYFNGC